MAKTKHIDKTTSDFLNVLDVEQNAILSRINCHGIGRIEQYDKTTQTASIQLMQVKQFENSFYTPALLMEVPLIIYGVNNGYISLPDPVGTICLVLFMDRNIDAFIQTGEMYSPDTARMHDFTDCVAITTFKTLVNPITDYDDKAITLFYTRTIEEIAYTSIIKNCANSILLQVSGNDNVSKINITDKFNIQNSSYSLAALIQELITKIKDIVVNTTTGALSQSSIDDLDEVAEKFEGLLV